MKKSIRYRALAVCLLLWAAGAAYGAAITMADLPYLCDFEHEAENANWTLNPYIETITTENRWVIGEALAYTGKKSIYVSQDGGETNTYASTNNVLLAYRDITLEAGDYDIAYDWKGLGNKTKGYMKVVYANRPTTTIKCIGNSAEPSWVSTSVQLMGEYTSLIDGDAWRHVQTRVSIPVAQANKTTTRLLFVWVNTDVTVKDSITSIALDNFQLAKASPNDYPSNIHVTTTLGTSTVSWEGNSESYEVMYRKRGEEEFKTVEANGNSVTLENVEYGAYEFWICCVNGDDKSIYTVFPTVYLYETDCFDALNMYNAEFEYGNWQHSKGKEVKGTTRIDYGYEDVRSRHTTHFDLTEVDPRTVITNNKGDTIACLKTVPEGEFGSVRLGNWATGSEYESITFHYTVESSQMAVMLVHYAMVLENPDHGASSQPRFTLDVLNEEGEPIDTKCASVDFHAPAPDEWQDPEVQALWHVNTWYGAANGSSSNSHAINWQDWKTIGISMEDYVGQTLTITLTSYDCDQGGHFGYAYFMLNCSRADVDGLPWGDGSTTQMFTAPAGFDYAWFNRTDTAFKDTLNNTNPAISPYITEGGRYFYVLEADTNTYWCHVTYPTNKECGFWFDASAKPHNAKAELAFEWVPEDCRNGFRWWNRSHVILTNQLTGEVEHAYQKQIENCFLLLDDGTKTPIGYVDEGTYVPVPDEGDTIHYGIAAIIYANDQIFADTVWYNYIVPAIGPQETHYYDTICRGESVVFPANSYNQYYDPGEYRDSLKSVVTGCDSTIFLHLTVHEPIVTEYADTICVGEQYNFNGTVMTTSGKKTAIVTSSVTSCDSVVTVNLYVAPRPQHKLLQQSICADESVQILSTISSYIDSIRFVVDRAEAVILESREGDESVYSFRNIYAGMRTAVIYSRMRWCDTFFTDTVRFNVNLASSVIEARFDDVLAFLAPAYNDGYEFRTYQWYMDGEPIEGATGSWYYNTALNHEAEITVNVTLLDGTSLWVCPFTFINAHRPPGVIVKEPSAAEKILRNGKLTIRVEDAEYDVLGRRL